jgi:hypothetical protein
VRTLEWWRDAGGPIGEAYPDDSTERDDDLDVDVLTERTLLLEARDTDLDGILELTWKVRPLRLFPVRVDEPTLRRMVALYQEAGFPDEVVEVDA